MNNNMIIMKEVGKSCLINMDGDIVVEPREDFDTIYFPSNGLCQVEREDRCGYIDMEGQVVIPLKYRGTYAFSESGLAFVECDNGLGGYINKRDEFIIKPIYDTGSVFAYGMAAVSKNGRYIFINEYGEKAIDGTFRYASGFGENGVSNVIFPDGRHGIIDYRGKVILTLKHGCELDDFNDTLSITTVNVNGKKTLVNANGEIMSSLKFDDIIVSSNLSLHPFLRNGLWGYIDNKANEVIPNIYTSASAFAEYHIAKVSLYNPLESADELSFYINEHGTTVESRLVESFYRSFDNRFMKVYRFIDGLALAVKYPSEDEWDDLDGDNSLFEYEDSIENIIDDNYNNVTEVMLD